MLKQFQKLSTVAPRATAYLLERLQVRLFPTLMDNGFEIAPEYLRMTKNRFGLIWASTQVPFQDRTVECWPTFVINLNRDLSPYFTVSLCEIPLTPIMCSGDALPRNEANCGHSVRQFLLRKGKSNSYTDQNFGAGNFSFYKGKKIDSDIELCISLINLAVTRSDRNHFLESVQELLGKKHIYESWNEATPDRPNRSSS